jgi:hypothetical protein
MIEFFKTLGSFLGLISFPFLIYDRIMKWRPIASLTIKMEGSHKVACIRISNITPHDFAIIGASVTPKVYFLTEDFEIKTLIKGAAGKPLNLMLKAGETVELGIAPIIENGVPLETNPQNVRFSVFWRRGNATVIPQFPAVVWTSTETIRQYGLDYPT